MVPHFLEVKTDQPSNIREKGWPTDIVPVSATEFGRILTESGAIASGACADTKVRLGQYRRLHPQPRRLPTLSKAIPYAAEPTSGPRCLRRRCA